jgi:hypothetical protein
LKSKTFVQLFLLFCFLTPCFSEEGEPVKLPYRFSGYVFGDYFYNITRDKDASDFSDVTLGGEEDLNGFIIRRIYFTLDTDISEEFAARFRLESSATDILPNGKTTVFVKDAYLQWKQAFALSDFYFGIHPTPAFEVSETAWRYRSLEKTIMDLRGIVTSRDIGVSLKGKLTSSGKYNYWVAFGNGSGNVPETDEFKRVYLHFHWKPGRKFQLTAYQDFRFLPDIPDPNTADGELSQDSFTTAWFLNYGSSEKYGLGYEGFFTHQKNGTQLGSSSPITVDEKTTTGHSVWAWYDFNALVGVVGRYDYFDRNSHFGVTGDARDLIIGSIVLRPHEKVWVMPNVFYETYQDAPDGRSFDGALTARITLYFIFP